jgi:hypothetical protein
MIREKEQKKFQATCVVSILLAAIDKKKSGARSEEQGGRK